MWRENVTYCRLDRSRLVSTRGNSGGKYNERNGDRHTGYKAGEHSITSPRPSSRQARVTFVSILLLDPLQALVHSSSFQ
jgi:hypothetical protein